MEINHAQIKSMHLIYANARATVIASSRSDANCKLPGVSSGRVAQPTVKVGCYQLASTIPGLAAVFKASRWATRGWTSQEALPSRR